MRKPVVRIGALCVSLLAIGLLLGTTLVPATAQGNSGYIRRFAANFAKFDGTEFVTEEGPETGGLLIYDKDFFAANDINTAYVTISAVGDVHNGSKLLLRCELDGNPCNPNSTLAGGANPGWIVVMHHENYNDDYFGPGYAGDSGQGGSGDVHDNVVYYTWCTPINGAGTHNVKLSMARQASPDPDNVAPNNFVFLEGIHFYIDGSRVADAASACAAT